MPSPPEPDCRPYHPQRHREAALRVWREVGWLGGDEAGAEAFDWFVGCGRALVSEVDGEAEALVLSAPGTLRYLDEALPFAGLTGVTVSRVARGSGLARALTARLVAADAEAGALVSGLGMFEQGFYDTLGFGSGTYDHVLHFDPAHLRLPRPSRRPRRVSEDDWEQIHHLRCARRQGHGAISFDPPAVTRTELRLEGEGFGLGFADGPHGELSHLVWFHWVKGENGPYKVGFLCWQTPEQLLEVLGAIRGLGDQVRSVSLHEPGGIQLQDLLDRPYRDWMTRDKSELKAGFEAGAYWQARLLDLPGCLARTHLPGAAVRFHLALSDPISAWLPETAAWRGVAGDYTVVLGPESSAVPGDEPGIPTLTATVNAFTRMWLGVRPASGLAVTDELGGPPELLADLDRVLRLPPPVMDWSF